MSELTKLKLVVSFLLKASKRKAGISKGICTIVLHNGALPAYGRIACG